MGWSWDCAVEGFNMLNAAPLVREMWEITGNQNRLDKLVNLENWTKASRGGRGIPSNNQGLINLGNELLAELRELSIVLLEASSKFIEKLVELLKAVHN